MKHAWNILLFVAILSALIPTTVCNAWWSISLYNTEEDPDNRTTHLQIGQEALNTISELEYPDLKQMRSGIAGGIEDWMSGPTDDERAHGKKYQADAGEFNGGPIDRWWRNSKYPDDGVLPQYKVFIFDRSDYSAYYYLAMMAHLVGDQAVPAHAANINHVQPWQPWEEWPGALDPDYGDNLENGADWTVPAHYTGQLLRIEETEDDYDPTFYYFDPVDHQGSLDLTQRNLKEWKYQIPSQPEKQYWNPPSNPLRLYQGQAFNIGTEWGHYGTNADGVEQDTYQYDRDMDTQKILRDQFTQAIQYTAGVLCAASRKLPPLVRDFALGGPVSTIPVLIDKQHGTDITFKIMENRTQTVKIRLITININTSKEYFIVASDQTATDQKWDWAPRPLVAYERDPLNPNLGHTLPWERSFTLPAWKGVVVPVDPQNGTGAVSLPKGTYALKIFVKDSDGNELNEVYKEINSDNDAAGKLFTDNDTQRYFSIDSGPEANLDLAVVFQPYFPYYNYTAGPLRRYRESLKDLLTALEGSSVPAENIRLISSGCESSTNAQGKIVIGECPTATNYTYEGARTRLNGDWPTYALGGGKFSANLLDQGISKAYEYLESLPQSPHNVRRALIFTNWVHWDPRKTPPITPQANGWDNPFETAVTAFQGGGSVPAFEFDAVDFYPSAVEGYRSAIANSGKMEQRYPFDLDEHFNTSVTTGTSVRPALTGTQVGYLALQNPYPTGSSKDWNAGAATLSSSQKKLLFPWINQAAGDKFQVQPGNQLVSEIPVDATMTRLSIGVTADVAGTQVSLVRPDGTVVEKTQTADGWLTDDPQITYTQGSDYYTIQAPEPGLWQVRLDGRALAASAQVGVRAYTTSAHRVDETLPAEVRPGEMFSFSVEAGGIGLLRSPALRVEFLRDAGSVYEIGERVTNLQPTDDGLGGDARAGDGRYAGNHAVSGYEGPMRYRVVLEGLDDQGHPVHRESDGTLYARGDPPTIEPLGPFGIVADPQPLIRAKVRDEVKIASQGIRLDGRALSCIYDSATGVLSARPTAPLAAGEHTVEVTAADGIAQEATPEVWTFVAGSTLVATDPQGDDRGPGYYTYPTDATQYPAGSFDLLSLRVGQSAGATLVHATGREEIAVTVGLSALATTQVQLNQVVDVYLDTDGIAGSGQQELLPGRNVVLESGASWEYVITMSSSGAVLRNAT